MKRLLAAKRAASAVCEEFARDRTEGTITLERMEELVERFVLAKFRLAPEEAASAQGRIEELAQLSLAKLLRIAPELVAVEDKPANCDGADSATVKQALMLMALKKEFRVEFDGFRAALCTDVAQLAALVWKALQEE
ncbi:MAG: hypothetical protein ACI36W_02195 [Coriobacteriales bacterium]